MHSILRSRLVRHLFFQYFPVLASPSLFSPITDECLHTCSFVVKSWDPCKKLSCNRSKPKKIHCILVQTKGSQRKDFPSLYPLSFPHNAFDIYCETILNNHHYCKKQLALLAWWPTTSNMSVTHRWGCCQRQQIIGRQTDRQTNKGRNAKLGVDLQIHNHYWTATKQDCWCNDLGFNLLSICC